MWPPRLSTSGWVWLYTQLWCCSLQNVEMATNFRKTCWSTGALSNLVPEEPPEYLWSLPSMCPSAEGFLGRAEAALSSQRQSGAQGVRVVCASIRWWGSAAARCWEGAKSWLSTTWESTADDQEPSMLVFACLIRTSLSGQDLTQDWKRSGWMILAKVAGLSKLMRFMKIWQSREICYES